MQKWVKVLSRPWITILIYLAGVAWLCLIFARFPQQGFMQAVIESWFYSKGLMFYKDFFGTYPPFLRLAMVLFHDIFGLSQAPTIYLSLANSIAVLTVLVLTSFKWLKGIFRLVPLLYFLIWIPYIGENHYGVNSFIGLTLLLAYIFWYLWFRHRQRRYLVVTFLLLSISFLSIQLVATVIFIIGLSVLFNRSGKQEKLYDLAAAVSFLAPIIIITLWFAWKGVLQEYLYWNIGYYFNTYPYTDLGKNPNDIWVFLAVHSAWLLIIPLLFGFYKKKIDRMLLIFTALILITLPITFWFAVFHYSRFEMSLPIYSLAFGWLLYMNFRLNSNKKLLYPLIGGIVALQLYTFYSIVWPKFYSDFSFRKDHRVVTELYPGNSMYDSVQWVEHNTPRNARIFVIGDPLFYVVADRVPASPRNGMTEPFIYTPLKTFLSELKKNPPDYWVVDERFWKRYDDWGYPEVTAFFNQLLSCEKLSARFDYWTVRQHQASAFTCAKL